MYSTRIITHPIDFKKDLQSPIVRGPCISVRRASSYVVSPGSTRHPIQRKPLVRLEHRTSSVLYRVSSNSGQSNIPAPQALDSHLCRLHSLFKCLASLRTMFRQCQNMVQTWFKHDCNIFVPSSRCILDSFITSQPLMDFQSVQ